MQRFPVLTNASGILSLCLRVPSSTYRLCIVNREYTDNCNPGLKDRFRYYVAVPSGSVRRQRIGCIKSFYRVYTDNCKSFARSLRLWSYRVDSIVPFTKHHVRLRLLTTTACIWTQPLLLKKADKWNRVGKNVLRKAMFTSCLEDKISLTMTKAKPDGKEWCEWSGQKLIPRNDRKQ